MILQLKRKFFETIYAKITTLISFGLERGRIASVSPKRYKSSPPPLHGSAITRADMLVSESE